MENLKLLVLMNNQILLTQIDEVSTELGEPDCKLVEPFVVTPTGELVPWLIEYTTQNSYMIHSDKILTICDPSDKLRKKYKSLLEG